MMRSSMSLMSVGLVLSGKPGQLIDLLARSAAGHHLLSPGHSALQRIGEPDDVLAAEARERARVRPHQVRAKRAQQLVAGAVRLGTRRDSVADRTLGELTAPRGGVIHRGMMVWGNHATNAALADRAGDLLRR